MYISCVPHVLNCGCVNSKEDPGRRAGFPMVWHSSGKTLKQPFNKQLSLIQILQQIALPYSAREHLSKDIVTILERLGKIDHTPFAKLYYLAGNCANRYYINVVNTFVKL